MPTIKITEKAYAILEKIKARTGASHCFTASKIIEKHAIHDNPVLSRNSNTGDKLHSPKK